MELLEPGCATKSMEFATIQSLKAGLGHNGGVQGKKASNRVGREHCSSTVQPISHAQFQARSKSSTALKGRGKTLHLPLFCSVDSRAFVSWLYEVECYFENNHFSEDKKSKLVISCLKGDALTWFRNATCANKDGMFKCKYWHKLKSSLKKMYLNKAVMNELENEFKNLKMDSLCVEDYATMFNELYFICGNPNDDSKKINLFYNGLNSEIQNWINIEQISSFELLCELALTSEYLIHEHEVHMESLARENAKHNVVVSPSEGLSIEAKVDIESSTKANNRHIAIIYEFKGRLEVDFYGINSKSSGFGIFPCYSDAFLNAGCDGPVSAGSFEMNALCTGSRVNNTKADIGVAIVQEIANGAAKQGSKPSNAFPETILAMIRYFITIFDPGGSRDGQFLSIRIRLLKSYGS